MTDLTQLDAAMRLAIAALIGFAVGVEREWSGHTTGPNARFAGVRTFMLLGVVGGAAGLLLAQQFAMAGALVLAAGMALSVAAYVMAMRRDGTDLDGTTEASALVVVALGAVAGLGWLALAAGVGSVVVLALREKTRLHSLVARVPERELRATLQFAALALVVLPLLPEGPFLGALAIQPRNLWIVVLIFSGLSYAGHLARRAAGPERGYGIAGALGGLVSSTAVTLTFSRQSVREPALASSLASGVVAASAILPLRVLVLTSFLNPPIARVLVVLLVPQAIVGAIAAVIISRRSRSAHKDGPEQSDNPLALGMAIKMAIAFELAVIALHYARTWWGTLGAYASGAILGLTDMDALTFSMTSASSGIDAATAARVIALGVIANGVLKLGCALGLGGPKYRVPAGVGLSAILAAAVAAFLIV